MVDLLQHQKHDLLVIGFGPAGAALALGMARRGYRVAVLEQHRVPRERLCGEFMSPDAMAALQELSLLPALTAALIDPPRIDQVRLTSAQGRAVERPLMPGATGLSRLALDQLLTAECRTAGVTIVEQFRAVAVIGDAEAGVAVRGVDARGERRTIEGRIAAGASGKGVGLSGARSEAASRFIAWKAHHRGDGPRGTVELHAFPGGYCGVAPIEGGRFNVCGIATRAAFARAGATLPGLFASAAASNAALAARLAALAPESERPLAVASLDFARRAPVVDSLLQLGDAAAGIAPLAGDGIGMALASAALAERWLAARLAGTIGARAMLAGYAREWRRSFRRRLTVGAALQELFIAPRAAAGVLAVLGAFPGLADRLVRETREPAEAVWRLPTVS